jgi:poly(hydroxyalkanoate) synthase III subunit E
MQAMYDQWLSMLPQFFAQFGAPAADSGGNGAARALPFPADQVAKAAALTQNALAGIAQSFAPLLQSAGAPALLAQWASAMPLMTARQNAGAASPGAFPFAPWLVAAQAPSPASGAATPLPAASQAFPAAAQAALLPFRQMQQAWLDMGNRLAGGTTDTYVTAFERTFGAVSDALGLGPMRKLQAAFGELMNAAAAQNEPRTAYAMLVQSAFASGWDELLRRLADKAQRGERVDSMLALIRLWASATEDAVHGVLQSQPGLDATAAVMRAALAYRRKLQSVAAIAADMLDMATRRELDEAYREIQQLKRELRSMRSPPETLARRDATGPGGDAGKANTGRARPRTRRTRAS